jgi:hypothetical protein
VSRHDPFTVVAVSVLLLVCGVMAAFASVANWERKLTTLFAALGEIAGAAMTASGGGFQSAHDAQRDPFQD